jgi:hypothetical protein
MKRTLLNILVCAGALAGGAGMALAQSSGAFDINWSTFNGGGGPSVGGNFSLNGTIGQPDAGTSLNGGGFTITAGFWAGASEAVPRLSIRLGAAGTVILNWPNPSTGFVLEESTSLSAQAGWTAVTQTPVANGANIEVTLQATSQLRFFRLRQH